MSRQGSTAVLNTGARFLAADRAADGKHPRTSPASRATCLFTPRGKESPYRNRINSGRGFAFLPEIDTIWRNSQMGQKQNEISSFSPGRPEKICAKRLLRFFFLRGCNFLNVSKAEFERVLDLINHRPRKRLNWRTLFDVFFGTVALA